MNERKKSIDELLSDLGVLEEAPVEVELKESGTPEAQGDPRAFLEEFLGGLLLLLEELNLGVNRLARLVEEIHKEG